MKEKTKVLRDHIVMGVVSNVVRKNYLTKQH